MSRFKVGDRVLNHYADYLSESAKGAWGGIGTIVAVSTGRYPHLYTYWSVVMDSSQMRGAFKESDLEAVSNDSPDLIASIIAQYDELEFDAFTALSKVRDVLKAGGIL